MGTIDLIKLKTEIEENKLVLPNFQRDYVWNNDEQQKGFLASILARIPLGNIITFNDQPDSFACRIIGTKEKLDTKNIKSDKVDFLLDGQQRVTTLLLMFSDRLFYDRNGNLISAGDLVDTNIRKRFFLSFPKYDDNDLERNDDFFGFLTLQSKISGTPEFTSHDIFDGDNSPLIEIRNFNNNDKDKWYSPMYKCKDNITNVILEAAKDNLVPLYYVLENSTVFKRIVRKIAECRYEYLYNAYLGDSAVKNFEELRDVLCKQTEKINKKSEKNSIAEFLLYRQEEWADYILEYIKDCVKMLRINQFSVTEEGKTRAIDIYEALNRGGVPLSTYDLIIARAAKKDNGKDLNEILQDLVDTYENEDLMDLLSNHQEKKWSKNRLGRGKEKNSINKLVLTQFLNLLSIVSNVDPGKMKENLKINHFKEKEILNLTPDKIHDNAESCMKAILDALMYLQYKQGVYKLSCIHYQLILLVVAYAFYYARKKGHFFNNADSQWNDFFFNVLNAWYKTAIFTDFYANKQNEKTKDCIGDIDNLLDKKKLPIYFDSEFNKRKNLILNVQHYNDKNMLLFNDPEYSLSGGVEKYISQYYLSKDGAIDILKGNDGNGKKINSYKYSDFQSHHLIPLFSDKTLSEQRKQSERRGRSDLINSPLNKVLITSDANKKISCMVPSQYSSCIPDGFCHINDFNTDAIKDVKYDSNGKIAKEYLEECYEYRYNQLVGDLKKEIDSAVVKIKYYIEHNEST